MKSLSTFITEASETPTEIETVISTLLSAKWKKHLNTLGVSIDVKTEDGLTKIYVQGKGRPTVGFVIDPKSKKITFNKSEDKTRLRGFYVRVGQAEIHTYLNSLLVKQHGYTMKDWFYWVYVERYFELV
jgi:ribonucleotide reductase alpha subunit